MVKRVLIWLLSILLAAALYLFENNAGTLTVLVGVLVVPIFGLLPLLGNKVQIHMQLDTAQEKGQTVNGRITVKNPGLLPMPRLQFEMACRNLRTGEQTESAMKLSLLPGQRKELPFDFICYHCGKIEIRIREVTSGDMVGLFSRKLNCDAKSSITVLPVLFEPAVSLEASHMAMPESDTYSSVKPGSDPGETFAIREYVPGDAIRKIHWKLSEKTDKLMVREFGLPVVNEVALLLETAGAQSAEETDAITEVFASISARLIAADIHHHVFWRDNRTDELLDYNVTAGDEFAFMLEQLLELPPKKDGDLARRFTQNYAHCPYSHVIIVGGRIPTGVRDLYNGNRVSILIPHRDHVAEGLQPDGTHVLSFTPHGYAMELSRLEV